MADFPYGTPVVYENDNGDEMPLAFITVKEGGQKADLAVMGESGTWFTVKDVSRSVDGGRNTWRTVVEKAD